jgi:hypothetical protein
MRGARSGVSYVVSVAIISMVTIALGLFLWGITAGWAGVSAFDMVKETNKGVAQQRSLLVVEFVDMRNRVVWVSNPGKVDLVILSCMVYPKNSNPPPREFREVKRVAASMKMSYPLSSSECAFAGSLDPAQPYVVEIYAIASTIYNPANVVENIQWAIVVRSDA